MKETIYEYLARHLTNKNSSEYIKANYINKYWTGIKITHNKYTGEKIEETITKLDITTKSTVRMLWKCNNDTSHTWVMSPYNMLRSNRSCMCPFCINGKAKQGLNDINTKLNEMLGSDNKLVVRYAEYLKKRMKKYSIRVSGAVALSHIRDDIISMYEDYKHNVINYIDNYGNKVTFYKYLIYSGSIEKLNKNGVEVHKTNFDTVPFTASNIYLLLECDCGHLQMLQVKKVFDLEENKLNTTINNVTNGCKQCNTFYSYINKPYSIRSGYGKILHEQFTGYDSNGNYYDITDERLGITSGLNMKWQCIVNKEHTWYATLHNRTRRCSSNKVSEKIGCPYCRLEELERKKIETEKEKLKPKRYYPFI